jgi:hypothetical protein
VREMLTDEEILGLFRFAGSAFKSAEKLDFAYHARCWKEQP